LFFTLPLLLLLLLLSLPLFLVNLYEAATINIYGKWWKVKWQCSFSSSYTRRTN